MKTKVPYPIPGMSGVVKSLEWEVHMEGSVSSVYAQLPPSPRPSAHQTNYERRIAKVLIRAGWIPPTAPDATKRNPDATGKPPDSNIA